VHLTPLEFSLLRALGAHAGTTLTRQDILNRVWGPDYFGDERTVDTHIRHLRAKLQDVMPDRHYITSIWGVGYKFEV
jgi:DNA-binding response OmpR family regulator